MSNGNKNVCVCRKQVYRGELMYKIKPHNEQRTIQVKRGSVVEVVLNARVAVESDLHSGFARVALTQKDQYVEIGSYLVDEKGIRFLFNPPIDAWVIITSVDGARIDAEVIEHEPVRPEL